MSVSNVLISISLVLHQTYPMRWMPKDAIECIHRRRGGPGGDNALPQPSQVSLDTTHQRQLHNKLITRTLDF